MEWNGTAHNFDPEDFQPTGTTQRVLDYDPFHNFLAGTVSTTSEGMQPLVGDYECEGTGGFELDSNSSQPPLPFWGQCGLVVPYIYPEEDIACRVRESSLNFTLTVEHAWVCFHDFESCFSYDESILVYMPQVGCEATAMWTSVLTDEQAGLRVVTEVTEELAYTEVLGIATDNA